MLVCNPPSMKLIVSGMDEGNKGPHLAACFGGVSGSLLHFPLDIFEKIGDNPAPLGLITAGRVPYTELLESTVKEAPMRKKTLLGLAVTCGLIGFPLVVGAHSGGLDAAGCHQNNTTGMYECHQGAHQGTVFASKEDMEKGAKGRPLEPTDRTIDADQKAKERAATEKADLRKARAEEKAEKKQAAAEEKLETTKAEREKTDANAKAEAKAEKKKAKAAEKAAKKAAKAEDKVETTKAEKEKTDSSAKAEAKAEKKKAKAEEKAAKKKAKAEAKAAKEKAKAEEKAAR